MDPRHLVQLATILEKGSMSRASQHLHLTQPTLTHNMQSLEMQAGGKLFERSRLGVRSTPLGEQLAREGRAISRGLKAAQELSVRHRLGLHTQVRIGCGPLIGAAILPQVATRLLQERPQLSLTLRAERPHQLVDQLIDGEHDLVIGPSWLERPPLGIERELLVDDALGVFCGAGHALASQARLNPGDADSLPWLSLGSDSPFTREVQQLLASVGVLNPRAEVTVMGEMIMLLQLLAQGRHLAVMPRFSVRALAQRYGLVELAVHAPPVQRRLYQWYASAWAADPGFSAVRAAVTAVVEAVGAAPQGDAARPARVA